MYTLFNYLSDNRPSIKVRGHWQNLNLVMDDQGSVWNAFQSDGCVDRGGVPSRPYSSAVIAVTLAPGSYSDFEAACGAPR